MKQDRRHFLKTAVSGAVWIGAGNTLKAFGMSGFTLPAKDKVKLRVAIASDGHYGQPKTSFEQNHEEMVSWINAEHADRGVDFACINGDLIHNDVSFLPAAKNSWDKLKTPYYVSHGNHDMIDEANWKKLWKCNWHYGFSKKDIGFVVLNTADEKGTYISPDAEKTRQLLKEYEKYDQLFVFMHITPVKWTAAGIDCPDTVSMFNNQSNLKAIFHGHDHDQDDVKQKDGRYYFFDSHVGGSWGTSYRGYRILEIMNSGDILTYQMNPVTKEKVNSKGLS